MTLSRVYFTCHRCGQHAHALDDRLGLDGFVSPHAQRLLGTLGADWSFERCARHRRTLLESGVTDLVAVLESESGEVSEMVGYLSPHADHTPYRRRSAEDRSIGSGMVEGTCKAAIGKRLKQTGARWKVRRLERKAALCCLAYSEQFEAYWKQAAG